MKTQKEIAELEAKLDFAALSGALLARLRRGELGQRKTINSLLDRISGTLVELRRHRVPLRQIVSELKSHGLPVSEGRLRAFLRARGGASGWSPNRRQKVRTTSELSATARAESRPQSATNNPAKPATIV
jgi:hypothetical protein